MRNARASYITAFTQRFAQMQSEGQNVHAEIRVEYGEEKRHSLYQQAVLDLITRDDSGAVSATRLVTSPVVATHPGLPVTSPIAWHAVTFRCKVSDFPEDSLVAWGNRWIHDDAPPLGPQDGLTGIIHFVGEPTEHDGAIEFEVDFGSAPIEAFEELIDMLGDRLVEVFSYGDCDT